MNREHKTKRIIKKYLRTDETHERNIRDKVDQFKNSRRSHSVKINVSKKSRRNTSLLLSLRQDIRVDKIQ